MKPYNQLAGARAGGAVARREMMKRRAVYLAAIGSGWCPRKAAKHVGIAPRTARRYLQNLGDR